MVVNRIKNMETINVIKVVDHSTLINSKVPKAQEKRWVILCKLACIAKYLNGDCIKTTNNKGYFIGISKTFKSNMLIQKIDDFRSIGILEHSSVIYSGIIYFEKLEYITKALEILNEILKLYLSTKYGNRNNSIFN